MKIFFVALASIVVTSGCLLTETDSSEQEETATEAEALASGNLTGCALEAGRPVAKNIVIDGKVETVTDVLVRLECPTPRRTLIKGSIKIDKDWASDKTIVSSESKIKTAQVHSFLVRYKGCVHTNDQTPYPTNNSNLYVKAWAYGIENGEIVDELKVRGGPSVGGCP